MIAYAFKDDAVIACILQFWPKMSAGIGSAYGSGKRRFRYDLETAAAGCRGSGKPTKSRAQKSMEKEFSL